MTKNIFLNKKYRLILINLIKKNKNIIESFVRDEMANHDNNDFSFREFNENFYVSVSKSYKHGVIKFNLGFPFPVFSMEEKIKKKGTKDFSFHFKGEELRLEQRNILKNIFNKTSIKSSWEELDSIGLFREKFDKTIKSFKFDKLLYIDPYSFIGDSFVGYNEYFCDYLNESNEPRKLHHLGLYYTVSVKSGTVKSDSDGQYSLGAEFVAIDDLAGIKIAPIARPMIEKVINSIK